MRTALRPLLASSSSRLFPPIHLVGSNGGGVRFKSISEIAEARRARMAKPVANPIGKKARRKMELEAKKNAPLPSLPEGFGERIWIHGHIGTGMTLYSLVAKIKKNRTMRTQSVFTGKKLAPGKLRKDYWRTLAVVDVGKGNGMLGTNLFQKLIELKKRHLLEWGEQAESLLGMDRRSRGEALNDQHGNTVADLAAVLAGGCKGNLIVEGTQRELRWVKWTDKNGKAIGGEMKMLKPKKKPEDAAADGAVVPATADMEPAGPEKRKLRPATVYWANEQDRFYAKDWTANVTHVLGLPEADAAENAAREVETKERADRRKFLDDELAAAQARKAAGAKKDRRKGVSNRDLAAGLGEGHE